MINPILAFSGRRRMRSARTAVLLTLYALAVLLFGVGTALYVFCKPSFSIYSMSGGLDGYIAMLIFQFVLILLVTPALTAGSISGERERQTLELLLVTNTGSLRIVLGKLLESLGLMLLLIVATLPAMCLPLLTGGVSLAQVLAGLLYLGVTAFAALSVGMLCSALFRRTVASTVMAYLAVFALGVVTLVPLIGDVSRLGAAYERMYSASSSYYGGPVSVIGGETPKIGMVSFVLNPALGLVSLIVAQTGRLRNVISTFSYTLYEMFEFIDFNTMAWLSMGFMAAVGIILNAVAACFVRPRKNRVHQQKTRKKA